MTSPVTLPSAGLLRVMCPECGRIMRLVHVEPSRSVERRADTLAFECECGFKLMQTIDRFG
jgi:hypothetical protein